MGLLSDGQRIGDNYEVERFLGQGAFAEVYRVQHRFLGRQAMKVFKRVGSLEETEEMLGEAILLSKMGHRNIVRVFNADTVETPAGRCGFFTMEYVPGGTLANFWHSHEDRFVQIEDAVQILAQICDGLAVAHAEEPPIIHRDITPQNILVGYDRDGLRVRISDFGLAKRADLLTGLASARGTIAFKAPETLRYKRGDSRAGDVWAIGTIAYLLLTDTLPFHDDSSPIALFGARRNRPPASPQTINSDVDDELAAVILGALEPDPHQRIPDAASLGRSLAEWSSRKRNGRNAKERVPLPRETTKDALGAVPRSGENAARERAERAVELARQASTLREAADLMEAACTGSARVRAEYEQQMRLWRKGIVG